jgi:hypothetical protein
MLQQPNFLQDIVPTEKANYAIEYFEHAKSWSRPTAGRESWHVVKISNALCVLALQ